MSCGLFIHWHINTFFTSETKTRYFPFPRSNSQTRNWLALCIVLYIMLMYGGTNDVCCRERTASMNHRHAVSKTCIAVTGFTAAASDTKQCIIFCRTPLILSFQNRVYSRLYKVLEKSPGYQGDKTMLSMVFGERSHSETLLSQQRQAAWIEVLRRGSRCAGIQPHAKKNANSLNTWGKFGNCLNTWTSTVSQVEVNVLFLATSFQSTCPTPAIGQMNHPGESSYHLILELRFHEHPLPIPSLISLFTFLRYLS